MIINLLHQFVTIIMSYEKIRHKGEKTMDPHFVTYWHEAYQQAYHYRTHY